MGSLVQAMRRDSFRYFFHALHKAEGELRAQKASLRSLRSDLAEDSLFDGTEKARARISEAIEHLGLAQLALERAREQLPQGQGR